MDQDYYFDNYNVYYFYDEYSEVLHRVSNAGKTDLQIQVKDLDLGDSWSIRLLHNDTHFGGYINQDPGLPTFVPLPLELRPDLSLHTVHLIKRGPETPVWNVQPLTAASSLAETAQRPVYYGGF